MPAEPRANLSRTDLYKPPQWADEGDNTANPANYAKRLAASAAFTAPLLDAVLSINPQPEYEDEMRGGEIDMAGKYKIWEDSDITIKGRLTKADESYELLTWALSTSDGGRKGPARSRTWLYTYRNAAGNTVWVIAKGCRPVTGNPTVTKENGGSISITCSCKYIYEVTEPTTPTEWQAVGFADAPANTVDSEAAEERLQYLDMGDFLYDLRAEPPTQGTTVKPKGTVLAWTGFSGTCTWGMRSRDSSGSDRPIYKDHGTRTCTGSVDFYKEGSEFNVAATGDELQACVLQLEKPSGTKVDTHGRVALSGNLNAANHLAIIAKLPGVLGNSIKITAEVGAAAVTATTVKYVRKREIHLIIKHGGDTFANIAAAINGNRFAHRMVSAVAVGNGNINAAIDPAKTTAGGADKVKKIVFERFLWAPSTEDLYDQSESTIESKSYSCTGMYAPAV